MDHERSPRQPAPVEFFALDEPAAPLDVADLLATVTSVLDKANHEEQDLAALQARIVALEAHLEAMEQLVRDIYEARVKASSRPAFDLP